MAQTQTVCSDSDSTDEEESSDSEEESECEITEQNLKLPGDTGKTKKTNIQVLLQQGE